MRIRTKTLWGRIDKSGNLLVKWDELSEFCSLQRDKNVIVRVAVQPKEPSEKTKNYYFGYICDEMQGVYLDNGERLSKEQVDERLRSLCPICYSEERVNGSWRRVVREFEELDQAEANEFFEFIFQYAAENYNKIIEDARN